ncbi:MAG: tRNA (adenosine(37)-N6)-threonylcarbamoyltransferase complex ATPase subunit type 1 TsaE [Parvularculaceae bacterium]|nr:tRNA (adenosine(37)-N6)-threonylcarbamoyltransferase complex ATPase subunit type 1 TsaE [Parvularculaceae bacterium]
MELTCSLPTEDATKALGASLAPRLRAGDVIALSGPLGAGKTSLARAIIGALTGRDDAPSPTFGLVETYETQGFTLWHFDLYRLEKAEDVFELGLEEALDGGVLLIEWPERIAALLPAETLLVRLSETATGRQALVRGSEEWSARLQGLYR